MSRYFKKDGVASETLVPATRRQLSAATITIGSLVVLALIGVAAQRFTLEIPPVYDVLPFFAAALFNAATVMVLLNMFSFRAVTRPLFYLAVIYGGSAIFSLLVTIALPEAHGAGALLSRAHALPWAVSLWHTYLAVSAVVYIFMRRRTAPPTRRFCILSVATNAVAVAACVAVAVMLGDQSPPLIPVNVILGAIAFAIVFRVHDRTLIDVAFSLALLAMALDIALDLLAPAAFSGTWYVERTLYLLTSGFVLIAALRTLSATRDQVIGMTIGVADSQRLLERNALRLNSLWYLASHGTGDGRERYQALLDTGTAAIRPGSSTFGYISHKVGETVLIDSTYGSALLPRESEAVNAVYFPGAVLALEKTIEYHLNGVERAAAWTDFSELPSAEMAWQHLGWTRVIGSSLAVGSKTYFIVFGSMNEIASDAYSEDDFTYVDVLAAFVAGRLLQAEQLDRIRFQVEHDALTGLHTRTQFRLAIRKAIREGEPFAVAAVNLDRFRSVNDESGAMVADELLVEVASDLDRVDDDDIAARLGADEFGLLLTHRQTEQITQTRLAQYFDVFRSSFATGLTEQTRRLSITASIGAVSFPEDGQTEQELMQRVNIALTAAKDAGGDRMTLFSRSMETIVEEQRHLTAQIREALARDEFVLEYQPTISFATGLIHGAEALIRWDHPTRGRLQPADFIPFSESHGLSIEIGRWVAARALRDIMSLPRLPANFRCYINISAPGLEDDAFVSNIRADFADSPGAVNHFGIEVTEGTAMLNAERAIVSLGALRRLGLRIAIDDFGTGYSSLSYLRRLPIDIIKIDRSFVIGLPHEQGDVAMTETLLSMASRFGLTTLAEGVETQEQATWLSDHGCQIAQGFLYSKSVPIGTLKTMLDSRRSDRRQR